MSFRLCFRRQFLRKTWQIQLAFLHFILFYIPFLSFIQYKILHFLHDQSNCPSPSFCSTRFQSLPGISDLISEVSNVHVRIFENTYIKWSFFIFFQAVNIFAYFKCNWYGYDLQSASYRPSAWTSSAFLTTSWRLMSLQSWNTNFVFWSQTECWKMNVR